TSRGGAEDVAASEAQRLGVGVSGVDELGPALEHEEARPPVDVRDQHRAARIAQEVLELRARLRDGNAHTAVARVYGDDAELRHPVPPERGQHALRVVVQELLDLRWQRVLCRHRCGLLECGAHDRGEGASGSTARRAFYPEGCCGHLLDRCRRMSYPALSKGWLGVPSRWRAPHARHRGGVTEDGARVGQPFPKQRGGYRDPSLQAFDTTW